MAVLYDCMSNYMVLFYFLTPELLHQIPPNANKNLTSATVIFYLFSLLAVLVHGALERIMNHFKSPLHTATNKLHLLNHKCPICFSKCEL